MSLIPEPYFIRMHIIMLQPAIFFCDGAIVASEESESLAFQS